MTEFSADEIRIDDLAQPRLTPVQRAAREGAAGLSIDLSVGGVLDAARAQDLLGEALARHKLEESRGND